jgi:ketosteroid isomerase-like protein
MAVTSLLRARTQNAEVGMTTMTNRLLAAMNAHDLDAFVACFAVDYDSQQPAHPNRAFRGRDQVRKNWQGVFAGIPDFTAELLLSVATDHGVEVSEWRWHGTHTDGAPFAMQGMVVAGVDHDLIAWQRLYVEPVEQGGADIDEMVQETYRPSA